MTQQFKTALAAACGIVAAVATWVAMDISGTTADTFARHGGPTTPAAESSVYQYCGLFSFLMSLLAGAAESVFRDTRAQRRRALFTGLACGAVAAFAAPALGIFLYNVLPSTQPDGGSAGFIAGVLVLAGIWASAGAVAGAVAGFDQRSTVIAARGAAGGFLGALIGGILFQLSIEVFKPGDFIGYIWRLGALTVAGMLSGLMGSLLPDVLRVAWLHRTTRRGMIREYTIGRSVYRIGSDSVCDIVLTHHQVAPVHAVLELIPRTGRYRLRHAARSPMERDRYPATLLNQEELTSEKWLKDGDVIDVGGTVFMFRDLVSRADPVGPQPAPALQRPAKTWAIGERTTAIPSAQLARPEQDSAPAESRGTEAASSATPSPLAGRAGEGSNSARAAVHIRSVARTHRAPNGRIIPVDTADKVLPRNSRPAAHSADEDGSQAPQESGDGKTIGKEDLSGEAGPRIIGTRLVCIEGPYLGQAFALTHETAVIGRSLDHPIAIPADTSVSRTHARIEYEAGRHLISDFGSSNGILVNGKPAEVRRELIIGDVIMVGATQLRYE
ncbi:MAG: FHA domain-containing protein [Capsulimonadaceae bacterium]